VIHFDLKMSGGVIITFLWSRITLDSDLEHKESRSAGIVCLLLFDDSLLILYVINFIIFTGEFTKVYQINLRTLMFYTRNIRRF
jgi:hypothetical protein